MALQSFEKSPSHLHNLQRLLVFHRARYDLERPVAL